MDPRSSKIILPKEKERRKRKSEEKETRRKKKAMVALLVFIMATLEIVFGRKKKLLDGILGPFGGNVFKNPALGIETCFLSQRLLLLMTRKTIGHGLKVENILPFFFFKF